MPCASRTRHTNGWEHASVGQRANRAGAALCAVGAVALLASTFLDWYPEGIEGAYFNRSADAPTDAGVFVEVGPLDAWAAFAIVDLLLAATAAVAIASGGMIAIVARGEVDLERTMRAQDRPAPLPG